MHQKSPGVSRIISVTGHGNVSATPDFVQLQVEIVTKGKEVSKATEDNAEITSRVIESILALGVAREDIQTASYMISPKYDYIEGKQLFR